ncbi:prolipoprotein diacylglyceryl transferase [Thalassobacillus devorans]|uniref:Phosphatidylglycerol--prolipoprotein diacylglyceryl transferase n=1 Tax=Thalassobacillus devorans TaxID=279813 RepID=A0ABQ1NS94_9BACI|nr:prolipoprotein diacylglyceryl transferase [Thalassobacillus devorans]NIK28913.1 phosphatidylglycerol:prolipoprotein diacylglycerol transferase [Thalassobacillus devorans]GGC82621.1 prolipoprotein diacylglyceryl transferase [Thalassobacillus devorans]
MSCSAEALDRVFLQLGPLSIYWYGVIIAAGAYLGLWLAVRETERLGLKKDLMIDAVVIAIPVAIISARIYYVIFEWERYAGGSLLDIFAIWEGGIAIHGALIGSVITAIVYARVKKVSVWMLLDIAAPSILLGQAIGRWGNFMNQEAHGGPVSESFYNNFMQYLPEFITNQMCIGGTMYHPTFLYESVWNILGFVLLLVLRRYNPLRGEVFLSYVIWYSIGRFFVEGLRTDSLYLVGDIRTAQAISIVLVVASIAAIIYRRKSKMADKHYNGKKA